MSNLRQRLFYNIRNYKTTMQTLNKISLKNIYRKLPLISLGVYNFVVRRFYEVLTGRLINWADIKVSNQVT